MRLLKTTNVGLLQMGNDHKHIVVFYCVNSMGGQLDAQSTCRKKKPSLCVNSCIPNLSLEDYMAQVWQIIQLHTCWNLWRTLTIIKYNSLKGRINQSLDDLVHQRTVIEWCLQRQEICESGRFASYANCSDQKARLKQTEKILERNVD